MGSQNPSPFVKKSVTPLDNFRLMHYPIFKVIYLKSVSF